VQERLKLSGQRWNKKGAQNVLNLRVVYKSGAWNKVIDLIKKNLNALHRTRQFKLHPIRRFII